MLVGAPPVAFVSHRAGGAMTKVKIHPRVSVHRLGTVVKTGIVESADRADWSGRDFFPPLTAREGTPRG